jgi:uncharacterized cupredoxin-like copper-binding protein
MLHTRLTRVVAAFGVCSLGLLAWVLGVAAGPAAGKPAAPASQKVTVVTVTAGQPSELAYKLSKFSNLPLGKVTFKVTNAGGLTHDFKICSVASTKSLNACKGVGTVRLAPGKTATLTVDFKKKGQYEYLCTVPGHARAGMKGVIGIGVKIGGGTSVGGVTGNVGGSSSYTNTKPCASPQNTRVQVDMLDYSFRLTPSTIPCGSVTFNMTNVGKEEHNFNVLGVQGGGAGNVIGAGETTSKTIQLGPGGYSAQCDVEGHLALGMVTNFTVTG